MLFFWVALGFTVLSFLAKGAKMGSVAKVAAVIAFLSFVTWLFTGPGPAIVDWMDNPSGPEIPDNIPIPGR